MNEFSSQSWGPRGTAGATFAARLCFDHVSMAYGAEPALKDVSFELSPGEIVCLLGPSGCGKSTLLRLAAGVEVPDSGRILLDGREISGPKQFVPPEKRGIGLMFQDFALFPHLTILQNVAFGLHALDAQEAARVAHNALTRVGMAAYADSFPHALSGGEQQRVALARAIVPRPQVMLMDEPFSGLDQRLRDSVRHETLAILRETRASSLLVTHDPVEAMGLADRILLMRRGKIVQQATPQALYDHPIDAEAARFFSDFNEIEVDFDQGLARSPFGSHAADLPQNTKRARVLIRPQGFVPMADGAGPKGRVMDRRYLGELVELQVLFPFRETPFTIRLASVQAPQRGELVSFAVNPVHVLVFSV